MTTQKPASDIKFDELTPEQQEAYIPRGEYKNPELLDQGNAPVGAPAGPLAADDDSVGDPAPAVATTDGEKPKAGRRRTA